MLDLSRDHFKLNQTSGVSQAFTIEEQHLPILQQGLNRWQDEQPADVGQLYVRYSRFNGHCILDLPVPPRLYKSIVPVRSGLEQRYQGISRNEFSHVRYTPVTCDPSSFVGDGYFLRPQLFAEPRQIEICVAISMYNEDDYLLGNTLQALYENIKSLQDLNQAAPWGPDSWQKIVVCIISDGRAKINPRTKAMLATLGVYQDAGMQQQCDGNEVLMHLFEYTTHSSIHIDKNQAHVELDSPNSIPCQTILCLKEKNQKKINSHRWFLTAVCKSLNPRVAIFLDAGSIPQANSLYSLWEPLYADSTVAAATGFCTTMHTSRHTKIFNPLAAFQEFEYQLTNTLERPIESILGRKFATNKGGFAAYQYSVIASDEHGDGAFNDYFAGERLDYSDNVSIVKANSFLTEDRAISSSLLRTDLKTWRTVAVDSAENVVEVPETISEFLLQRRRYINGDFYSTLLELGHVSRYVRLQPSNFFSLIRILGLLFGTTYQAASLLLQFFAIGNLFAIFNITITSLGDEIYLGHSGRLAAFALSYVYIFVLLAGLICSIGNRPRNTKSYVWLSLMWMLIFCYFFASLLYLIIRGTNKILDLSGQSLSAVSTTTLFLYLVWPLIAIVTIWIISPLTLWHRPHGIASCIWYPIFLPLYTNLVTTYAVCNSHDLTWGTKGGDMVERLPYARVNGALPEEGDVRFQISSDQMTGDMIIHDYNGFLSQLDTYFEQQRQIFEAKPIDNVYIPSAIDKMADYFPMYRTITLLSWLALNSALVMTVLNIPSISSFKPTADGGTGLGYVGSILWAYAGLAGFQYCFTILYSLSKLWKYLRKLVATQSRKTALSKADGKA